MKLLAAILPVLFLSSCMIAFETPTFAKPGKEQLAGSYVVSRKSPMTPHKRDISAITLELERNGSFRLEDPRRALNRGSGSVTGKWRIQEAYGMDLGSRHHWGVMLAGEKSRFVMTADCLSEGSPHDLLFSGKYVRDGKINQYFVMKKRR